MNVVIKTIPEFDRRVKRLAKKYPSMKQDLYRFVESIRTNPLQGSCLGNSTYKVRMPIKSKGGGKSGGARILTYAMHAVGNSHYEVTFLTIYDKGEIDNVSDSYIASLVAEVE